MQLLPALPGVNRKAWRVPGDEKAAGCCLGESVAQEIKTELGLQANSEDVQMLFTAAFILFQEVAVAIVDAVVTAMAASEAKYP